LSKLVFVDAGVLIAAARGTDEVAQRALGALDDPDAVFASSIFVKLEVLPKAVYHKKSDEARFYETYFDAVTTWVKPDVELLDSALDEAIHSGLSAIDAIHVVSAASVGAHELVTSEGPNRPIHRTKRVRVRSILPERSRSPHRE